MINPIFLTIKTFYSVSRAGFGQTIQHLCVNPAWLQFQIFKNMPERFVPSTPKFNNTRRRLRTSNSIVAEHWHTERCRTVLE